MQFRTVLCPFPPPKSLVSTRSPLPSHATEEKGGGLAARDRGGLGNAGRAYFRHPLPRHDPGDEQMVNLFPFENTVALGILGGAKRG